MTDKLPPNLLALFTPRPPLRYLPHADHASGVRHTADISGIAQFLPALKEYAAVDQYEPTESWLQRRDRIRAETREKNSGKAKEYKPMEDAKKRGFGDPYRTLFVARLNYSTEVKDLEREFGRFGPIERIRIVTNSEADDDAPKKRRYRGYAFVVFERENDMKAAYKETDGIRIKDRRVLVDVERGRTVNGWRPRRLGGGLGGRDYTKARPSGPVSFGPPAAPGGFRGGFGAGARPPRGGGFRGGFGDRGGFRGGGFGGRGGIGYQPNGHGSGAAPDGAPSGPRGPRREGGYGGGSGRYDDRNGGRSNDDRPRGSGSNREPVGSRHGGGGYRDRDRDRDRDTREGGYGSRDDYRKRPHDGDSYDEQRHKRRY